MILVEELVTNALHHGRSGPVFSMSLELTEKEGSIGLSMEDNGRAFDPLAVPPVQGPDPETGGGIGLAIVHAWASDPRYARKGEMNLLRLTLS